MCTKYELDCFVNITKKKKIRLAENKKYFFFFLFLCKCNFQFDLSCILYMCLNSKNKVKNNIITKQ